MLLKNQTRDDDNKASDNLAQAQTPREHGDTHDVNVAMSCRYTRLQMGQFLKRALCLQNRETDREKSDRIDLL